MSLLPIHPFPARMAPELARQALRALPPGGRVVDPMCGSGTVPRSAVEAGFDCVGIDIDPLATLMARVWVTDIDTFNLADEANYLVESAKELCEDDVQSIVDTETEEFIGYWFAPRQKKELSRLTTALKERTEPIRDALAIALSRIVITKEMRASLARDTSHSRPHKVANTNEFDVYAGFIRSAKQVELRLRSDLIKGTAEIYLGDARELNCLEDDSFDLALTSPPYLNAIDYMRGHRLMLVWLGYNMKELKETRSSNVGAERSMPENETVFDVTNFIEKQTGSTFALRHLGWIRRYASDMDAVLRQLGRVVKNNGKIVMVLGNSFIRGATVNNAGLIEALAESIGFGIDNKETREIPARRRYLPPPGDGENSLDARMRTETVLTCVAG